MPKTLSTPLSAHLSDAGALSNRRGAVGEMLVAAEMTARGFVVSFPQETVPYDLVADWQGSLSRVQVKAATEARADPKRYRGAHRLIWRCSLSSSRPNLETGRARTVYTPDRIDFLVICLIGPRQFYILPADRLCRFGANVRLYPGSKTEGKHRTLEPFLNRWDLLQKS